MDRRTFLKGIVATLAAVLSGARIGAKPPQMGGLVSEPLVLDAKVKLIDELRWKTAVSYGLTEDAKWVVLYDANEGCPEHDLDCTCEECQSRLLAYWDLDDIEFRGDYHIT